MLRGSRSKTRSMAMALAFCTLSLPALARPPARSTDPDAKAMQTFTLTPGLLSRTVKVQQKLLAAAKHDPSLRKQLEKGDPGSSKTIAEMEKRVDANPALASAIRAEGLTTHDYLLTSMAALQAMLYASMKQQFPTMKLPADLNPANVDFAQRHPEAMQAYGASLQQLGDDAHER